MLHLDGWVQQPTYWWHIINPLFLLLETYLGGKVKTT
jgi:hypothetical protein